jgi:hypothetical protein
MSIRQSRNPFPLTKMSTYVIKINLILDHERPIFTYGIFLKTYVYVRD